MGRRISKKELQFRKAKARMVREWWHGILRDEGDYSCSAVFLTLPSDLELIQYLSEFGDELEVLSGDNCLVIAISNTDVRSADMNNEKWKAVISEQIFRGYSTEVARQFAISFDEFPCLVVFQDIRKSEHTVITLKGMATKEVAERLRIIFATIENAVSKGNNPINDLLALQKHEVFQQKEKAIISEMRSVAGKTLEKAMEATITAIFKV